MSGAVFEGQEGVLALATDPAGRSRIVSLVPSWTEALFALGLGPRVVGVTDWCVHPADALAALPRIGGTKNPDTVAIGALAPDLVIANQEENTRRSVEALSALGIDVWLTYPRTVAEGVATLESMRFLAPAGEARTLAARLTEPVREAFELARSASGQWAASDRPRVFCPIWRDPWMAVARSTYIHDLIELCGGENVFAERGDRRYPIVTLEDVVAAQPEVILLPDEPYAFEAEDVEELMALDTPAGHSDRIHPIDGTLLSWYGPRIAQALPKVRELLRPSPPPR